MGAIDLNGIRLRNRLLTSASLLGYGASKNRLILYGLSPIAQWVPLERFGAVTTRTVTLQPREGHFTLKEDWGLREFPAMLRIYGKALKRVDAGWLNAFGWSNIGIERYFDEYFGRTANLNRIVSVGGFSADEIEQLFETVNERAKPGEIAAVELNALVPQRQLPVRDDPRGGAPAGRPEEPPPGDPQGQPGRGLPLAGAPGRRARLRRGHRDQHGQGPAAGPEDRRAVPQEPLRGDLGQGDQAHRAAGRRGAARRRVPAADHRQRRDRGLRRLPRVLLGGRRRGVAGVVGVAQADAAVRAGAGRGGADPAADRPGARYELPATAPHWVPVRPSRARADGEPAPAWPIDARGPRRPPPSPSRPREPAPRRDRHDRRDHRLARARPAGPRAYLETGVRLEPGALVASVADELATVADAPRSRSAGSGPTR